MDAIIALAERLGKAIAESPRAVALREARTALNEQPDAVKLMDDFRSTSQRVAQLQAENKPIEVDDKHKLQELQDQLVACETFKKFNAAQVEYVDLMRKVDGMLRRLLTETESGQAG